MLKANDPKRAGERADIYRCFVIPIPIDSDRTVAAFEFRPGNRKVVHHALLYLDNTGAARKRRGRPGPGYTSFGGPGIIPSGGLGGGRRRHAQALARWHREIPSQRERPRAPDSLPPRRQARDRPVGRGHLLHARNPPENRGRNRGAIAQSRHPGRGRNYRVKAQSDRLPVDVEAIGIAPHMHYIGKEMKVVAESPDGKVPLIWIKDWDFNWQGQYQFSRRSRLSKVR